MSDTTVTNETPTPTPTPLPNDQAARSPTGEILEPSQIQAKPPEAKPADPDGTPAPTSTPKPEDKPETKPAPTTGAPEKYEAFKAPEGATLSDALITEVTPMFKEMNLTQDQAQKLVDFHSKAMLSAAKAPEETYLAMRNDWQAKVRTDPDLAKAVNGDKTGLDAVKLDIGRALNAIGDPALVAEFKSAMDLTGAGDNPAFVKAMWKLSQHVTEGKHVAGGGPSPHGQADPSKGPPKTGAAALYPNLPQ